MATYTARFSTRPSVRIFTTSASSGRVCQALTSSITASVTFEINAGDTSTRYISSRWPWISRVVMPRAYNDRILSSNPAKRVCPLATSLGSKLPCRSRGTSISTSPKSPFNCLLLTPLRLLPLLWPSGECFS